MYHLNQKGRLINYFYPDGKMQGTLSSGRITDLCMDNNQNLWIATNLGIAGLQKGSNQFQIISDDKGNSNRQFAHIHQAKTGEILATTESSGVYELTIIKGRYKLINIKTGGVGEYQTIFEDNSKHLYLPRNSMRIDVFRFQNNRLILLDSIPVSGLVNGFYEDECNETLYFGTSNGLVKVDKNNLHADPVMFTEKDGLPGKFIGELEADANGNLWLGTNRGLAFFDKANQTFRSFSLADGAQSLEFHITASMKSRNGELWFGGSEGITIVPADGAFRDVQTAPKVVVTGIKINDEEPDSLRCVSTGATNVSQIRRLQLKYSQRTVSFEFIAIEYSDPLNNQLMYKLEGRDDNWVELEKGKPGFARYSKLPHGNYTLMLQGANSDGVWGPPQEVIYLNIATPFFLSRWFFALLGLAFLSLVYAVYRNRVERIRKKEEMLRKEAEVRQQMAETETAILRLQMNPHFIFNSMNSINAYILKKDINTASDYLGRFAKLMRMILDLAAKPFIPVSDEIELLKLYLQTEAMRFEHKFSYVFEVDESLDPDDVVLPTMILQPFVENAIWHGLSNKKGEGLIRISFKKENEMLHCVVEDNGIGRDAALQSKSGVTVHESKAMSITLRRLELLEKNADEKASCQVLDLVGPEGRASGTRIVLNLPFL
ncbi:MAG: histidine kinase [Saprospirales bacterium]|nr:histidine kinase [Saprospirales bacterium]